MAKPRRHYWIFVLALIVLAAGMWIRFTADTPLAQLAISTPYAAIEDLQRVVNLTSTVLVNRNDDIVIVLDDTRSSGDIEVVLDEEQASVNRGGDTEVVLGPGTAPPESQPPSQPEQREPEKGVYEFPQGNRQRPQLPPQASPTAALNFQRRQAFIDAQADVKAAPTEERLPPVKLSLPPQTRISRGREFVSPELITDAQPDLPIDSPARLIGADARAVFYRNEEARYIIMHKTDAASSPIPGEVYGKMKIALLNRAEMAQVRAGTDSPYQFVVPDLPINITITDADEQIQGPLMRLQSGAQGAAGVCIIDTGIDHTLAEFTDNYVGGTDLVDNDTDPMDEHGHGTMMASAIVGIAPGAQLYIVKALDTNASGYSSDVIKGIDWCMQQNVTIISMSLGGGHYESWCDEANVLAQKANEAAARGFFVAAAAGNRGAGTMLSPACGSLVTSVAATAESGTEEYIANYSSLSNVTDILAPGTGITLTTLGGSSRSVSGTSAANAILAGSAAVALEATGLQNSSLQDRLRGTGIAIEHTNTSMLYPRVDIYRAYMNDTNNLSLVQDGFQSNLTSPPSVTGQDLCTEDGPQAPSCTKNGDCTFCIDCLTIDNSGTCDTETNNCITLNLLEGEVNTQVVFCSQEDDLCTGGASATCNDNYCGVAGDQDGDGDSDGCDTDCGVPQCTSGTCCDTVSCTYESAGQQSCGTCQYCTGSSSSCSNVAAGLDTYSDCSNGYSCSGQTIINGNVCDGSGSCGDPGTTCSDNCNSVCVDGDSSCYNTAAGSDPEGLCAGSTVCSGQSVINNGLCGTGTACGYTVTTCAATCDSYCSSGACQNSAAGTDPYGLCSGGLVCTSGDVYDESVCGTGASCGNLYDDCSVSEFCSGGACFPNQVCGNDIVEGTEQCDGTACCTGSCTYSSSGTSCGSGTYCSGQGAYADQCNGAGTCVANLQTTCAGTCNSYCSGGACQDSSAGTDPYGICSGSYTCSGQTILDNSVCGTGAGCGNAVTTCGGNCNSLCVSGSGSCYDTAAGADPHGLCSSGVACSGQSVVDSNVCGTSTSCGYTTQTCGGTENSYCSGGSCNNYCSTGGDQDGGGEPSDACDTNCAAGQTARGGSCSCDYECSASSTGDNCITNVYQGGVESARCAPADYCVTDASSPFYFAGSGTVVGDSACYGSATGGSVWLATAGRFAIKSSGGTVLGVIDKYGSMGVRGTAAFSQGSFDSGWQVKNGATTRASISSASGNLKAASTLAERTTPSCTGFQVKNAGGTVVACVTSTGAVQLVGDLASSLTALS